MLLAVRIPLISDHDRFVARSFRIHVKPQGAWRANLCIRWAMNFRSPTIIRAGSEMAPLLDRLGCVIDHEVAYSRGGPHAAENLAIACNVQCLQKPETDKLDR
jgi:hypothetical protein